MECIVLLETDGKKNFVAPLSLDFLQKLFQRPRERTKYKGGLVRDFVEQSQDVAADLLIDKITNHENCMQTRQIFPS